MQQERFSLLQFVLGLMASAMNTFTTSDMDIDAEGWTWLDFKVVGSSGW
jgi:hypothetical protein